MADAEGMALTVPFTPDQRKFFNAAARSGDPEKKKLAEEANRLKKKGIELPPKPDDGPHEPWKKLSGK